MKIVSRFAALFATCALLFSMTACGDEKKVLESSDEELTVVMTVGGHDVYMELYRYVALNYKSDYESGKSADIWLGESGSELMNELDADVRESIIYLYATLAMCEEYGIHADDSYITESLDIVMDSVYEEFEYDYEAYDEMMAQYHMNDGVYRFIMRNDLLAEELLHAMTERGEIPTDRDEIRAIFDSDEFIRVKQILVSFENGKTDEENLETAEKLLERINNGEDFDTLVQQYGEDLYMFNNDDGYYFARGRLDTNFEDAAFELEIGEVSDIVKTSAGYSIIKRYEKDSAYIDKNFDDLYDDYIDGCYNIAVEEFEKTLTVTETDALKNYSIFNLTDTED